MKIFAMGRAHIQKSKKTLEELFLKTTLRIAVFSTLYAQCCYSRVFFCCFSVFGLSLQREFTLQLFQKIGLSLRVILILICTMGDFDFEIFSTSYANRCSSSGFSFENLQYEFSSYGEPNTEKLKNLSRNSIVHIIKSKILVFSTSYVKCSPSRGFLAFLYLGSLRCENFVLLNFIKIGLSLIVFLILICYRVRH